jgi:hypothetical protein
MSYTRNPRTGSKRNIRTSHGPFGSSGPARNLSRQEIDEIYKRQDEEHERLMLACDVAIVLTLAAGAVVLLAFFL